MGPICQAPNLSYPLVQWRLMDHSGSLSAWEHVSYRGERVGPTYPTHGHSPTGLLGRWLTPLPAGSNSTSIVNQRKCPGGWQYPPGPESPRGTRGRMNGAASPVHKDRPLTHACVFVQPRPTVELVSTRVNSPADRAARLHLLIGRAPDASSIVGRPAMSPTTLIHQRLTRLYGCTDRILGSAGHIRHIYPSTLVDACQPLIIAFRDNAGHRLARVLDGFLD